MDILKMKRMGIEWGSAYVEAEPRAIYAQGAKIAEIYVAEGFDIVFEFITNSIELSTHVDKQGNMRVVIKVENPV